MSTAQTAWDGVIVALEGVIVAMLGWVGVKVSALLRQRSDRRSS